MAAGQKKFDSGVGKWLGVARSAVKNLEPGPRHDLLDGLKLLFDGSFDRLASGLVKMRNDDAHDRIEATRLDEATEKFKKLIDDCLEELAFLVRFPLFRVCSAETERSTRASAHQVEMLVGSDPVHDRRTFKWDLSLSPGLYIQGNSGPEDLFPFVTFRRCRHCNRDEIFFLDSFERHAREWKLKSFETGHSLIVDDIGESIAKWVRE